MHDKMSTSSQNNGKKSSNSSIANTPSSTPLTNIANGNAQGNMQNSPPPNNNAPKYGTLVPNRIFVGGVSANTAEGELMQLFSNYGTVKAAKIIQDRAGVSKGYGFITFESEDDAKRPLREAENIVLRERKLNIAPAIKKQPFSRAFDASSPSAVAAGNAAQFFFPPGATVPYFQGGVAYYPQPAPAAPGDPSAQQPVYQPPPVYPAQTGPPQAATYPSMMFPTQTIYMPQQYPMPMPFDYNYYQSNGAPPGAQYMVGGQGGPGGTAQCAPMPPSSSPPRPPCYNQQIPAYNPADPMFCNLPVYGAAMEGPPVYSEAFDLGTPGPYAEEYTHVDQTIQDVELSAIGASPAISTTATNVQHPPPPVTSIPPPLPPPQAPPHHSTIVAAFDSNANKTSSPLENNVRLEDVPTTRNSTTPVVSLLTIDQQQEKDYFSMQGGRRRKPPTQNNHVPHVYPSNGYINPFQMNFNQTPPTFPPYGTNMYQNGPTNYNNFRRMNGFDNRANRFNKRRASDGKTTFSNDHSSRSSLRTDSNSSASCVDENKNEEKLPIPPVPAHHVRITSNTPPPAPYSPMTQQYRIITNNNNNTSSSTSSRSFPNSSRYNNYYNNNANYNHHYYRQQTYDRNKMNETAVTEPPPPPPHPHPKNIVDVSQSNPNPSFESSVPQVHVAASQSFSQARRNRRSIRRSGSSGVNEIGAGDAPLPSEVGGEVVCKKLETLKL